MITIGSRIRKVLPEMQTRVEGLLEVHLGNVEVKPLIASVGETMELAPQGISSLQKNFARVMLYGLTALFEVFPPFGAQAGTHAIYYSRNPIMAIRSTKSSEYVTAHELGHVAHAHILGKPLGQIAQESPGWVVEGFAEYNARRCIAQKYDRPFEQIFRFVREYEGYHATFTSRICTAGVQTPADLKQFLIKNS